MKISTKVYNTHGKGQIVMHKSWQLAIGLMSAVFVVLVLLMPIPPGTYRTWFIVVELPVIILWIVALYGAARLKRYAAIIAESPEGAGFSGLARGCQWVAWGLPISAIAGLALALVASHQANITGPAVIASNYVSLIFPILAFSIMSNSTASMRTLYDLSPRRKRLTTVQQAVLALIGVAYAYLLLRNLRAVHGDLSGANNPYFLPLWLVVIGLLVPYLYAWFLGLLTVFDLIALAMHSPGLIYQRALRLMGSGIVTVICSLMGAQFLRAQLPQQQTSLWLHLLAVYAVYSLAIAGFLLLLVGVHQLQKIEEV